MEQGGVVKSHKLTLDNRKKMTLTGIKDVVAFDLNQILLESSMGMIHIKGKDLKVTKLNVDSGLTDIEGYVDSIMYSEPKNFSKKIKSGFFKNIK